MPVRAQEQVLEQAQERVLVLVLEERPLVAAAAQELERAQVLGLAPLQAQAPAQFQVRGQESAPG